MEFVAFPLRIEPNGQLARSESLEKSLVDLLRLMLTTPAAGWLGSPNFGLRDSLAELPFKSHVRTETIRRVNENLRDLGIDGVEVKMIEIDPKGTIGESVCLLTLAYKGKGTEVEQVKL